MALNIAVHQTVLYQILKDIYSDTQIAPFLGFKGGTAAAMFYGLDRFSVDLDFDLLDNTNEDLVFERVVKIVKKYGVLKDAYKKRFNLFCLVSYEDGAHKIKVEISRIPTKSKFEIKTYLGISTWVMIPEDVFANKLMAMSQRMGKTSRDIYDVWFFLSKRFPINKELIEEQMKIPFAQFLNGCINKLEKMKSKNILDGLGELLTASQKDWAKAKLQSETIALLKLRYSVS